VYSILYEYVVLERRSETINPIIVLKRTTRYQPAPPFRQLIPLRHYLSERSVSILSERDDATTTHTQRHLYDDYTSRDYETTKTTRRVTSRQDKPLLQIVITRFISFTCDRYGQYFTARATTPHAARLKRDLIHDKAGPHLRCHC
jgi:hypothetical protein